MSQYKTGTATVTNGSATVTGSGTLWLANVTAGDSFTVAGDGVMYDVASVDSNTQITLSVAYAGSTASGAVYAIGTSFTVPDNFPEMSQGDIETATVFTRAMRKIQSKFTGIAINTTAEIGQAVNDHVALPDPHTQYEPRLSVNMVWDSVSDDYSRDRFTSGITPIHEAMRRCVVRDDKTVAYYLDPNDSNLKADGTASDLTGTDGQVMVEIRKFYVRISKLFNGKYKREISEVHQSGFVVHPAFAIGGTLQYDQSVGMWHYVGNTGEKSVTYVGAYQASVYSASGATHIDGLNLDNNDSRVDTATDTLASVSGKYPMVGLTRDQFRTLASNKGEGWSQWAFWQLQAVKLLFFVEYGTFNGQAALTDGNVSVSSGYPGSSSNQTDSPHSVSGKSDTTGNGSGGVNSSTRDTAWLSYRGIENFWGNAWQWCDGWNINDQQFYVSNDSVLFADNTATGYGLIGDPTPTSNGYIRNVQHRTLGDVPSDTSGNSSTAFADYQYRNPGWRVALVGGVASSGSYAGPSCVSTGSSSGFRTRYVAGRLAIT